MTKSDNTAGSTSISLYSRTSKTTWYLLGTFALFFLLPLVDTVLFHNATITEPLKIIFIFSILGASLHILSGFTGLLSLGIAGFMALGSYAFAISTSNIYPFQLSFFGGIACAIVTGAIAGLFLGLPTLRLRGDYLAIVTLGFGEIVQDILRNLEVITKGTQGINPLPSPHFFGVTISGDQQFGWYYVLLTCAAIVFFVMHNIEHSKLGRALIAIRDDELAAHALGFEPFKIKLRSFIISSACASFAGALWASFLASSGEPGNFDFNISALALCIVIVGGLGNLFGVLLGSIIMIGFNSVVLTKASLWLTELGLSSSDSAFTSPNNYKYFVFGFALVLMMRLKPQGLFNGK